MGDAFEVLFALEFLYLSKCKLLCPSWCVLPVTQAGKHEYGVDSGKYLRITYTDVLSLSELLWR